MVPMGIASDLILLKDRAVKEAMSYRRKMGEPTPVAELARKPALFMHSYTVRSDVRPLGCMLLIGGSIIPGATSSSWSPAASIWR